MVLGDEYLGRVQFDSLEFVYAAASAGCYCDSFKVTFKPLCSLCSCFRSGHDP